jgi:glycerophosphoryl diester phosphodiesterase
MSRPLIVAHRALTPGAIENTRSAIARAAAAGADLIELDVRLTIRRQPVVIHDAFLGRITRGRGWVRMWPVWALGLVPFRDDTERNRISTVRKVLGEAPQGAQLVLHLKDRAALRPVLRMIRRHGDPGRTWLWLEHERDVFVATRALPELRVTLLRPSGWKPGARQRYVEEAQWNGAAGISLPWGVIDAELLRLAHQHHLRVFSRLESMDQVRRLSELGLDGIVTDDPAAVRAILDAGD